MYSKYILSKCMLNMVKFNPKSCGKFSYNIHREWRHYLKKIVIGLTHLIKSDAFPEFQKKNDCSLR